MASRDSEIKKYLDELKNPKIQMSLIDKEKSSNELNQKLNLNKKDLDLQIKNSGKQLSPRFQMMDEMQNLKNDLNLIIKKINLFEKNLNVEDLPMQINKSKTITSPSNGKYKNHLERLSSDRNNIDKEKNYDLDTLENYPHSEISSKNKYENNSKGHLLVSQLHEGGENEDREKVEKNIDPEMNLKLISQDETKENQEEHEEQEELEEQEEQEDLSDVSRKINHKEELHIKKKNRKIKNKIYPLKHPRKQRSSKNDFTPDNLILKRQVFPISAKSQNVKENFSKQSNLSNKEKRLSFSKMQIQIYESTKDLFIESLKHSSRINDKYIAARHELNEIKNNIILERKANFELEQTYNKLLNQQEYKKSLNEELKLLKESYKQLQISFDKSEEIRKYQKKLIKNLQTEIDSLRKPKAKSKQKPLANKKSVFSKKG